MDEETWKDVPGYEGIYEVSTRGQVKTVPGKVTIRRIRGHEQVRHWNGRILKQKTDKNGYKRVTLWRNKCGKDYLVHRLVCLAFIPNPKRLPDVNHKDGNPSNNNLTNLEWITPRGNLIHAFKHRLNKSPDPVVLVDPETEKTKYFMSKADASKFLGKSHGYFHEAIKRGETEVDGYEVFTLAGKKEKLEE